ncbi:hypothetical protein SBRCBS47491_002672 [Sporothrix bragantina]|uniref:Uncharacterized protein n=1 Tax=Sporothrix bragantina TaxID=671064 RepID=A0ABP0B8X7_9PEZI
MSLISTHCPGIQDHLSVTLGKKGHLVYHEIHAKYGPVVRTGPYSLSFDDARAVKAIYGKGTTSFPRDNNFPAVGLNPDHLPVFFCIDAATHQAARRKVGSAYTMSSILNMEDRIDSMAVALQHRLDEAAANGRFFDISKWIGFFSFDVISYLAYGDAFGCLATGDDVNGILAGLQGGLVFTALFTTFSGLFGVLFSILGKVAKPPDDSGIGFAIKMANQIVEDRYARPSDKRDLLNAIIASKNPDGVPIHRDQVRGEVIATLVAGGDTTSLSILGCLGFLLQHPDVLARLKDELASVPLEHGREVPRYQTLQALPYLTAVIQETLRLSPSVGAAFTRRVPAGGAEVLPGQFLPGNTVVSVNNWVFGRNKEFYGHDAEQFRPERWIESDEETIKRMKNYEFSFGHGARICIGRNLALVELYKVVYILAQRYDIVPRDPSNLYTEELKLFLNKTDMMVKMTRV